jgi:glycosyltransferase involved in cell wall biosynthesis
VARWILATLLRAYRQKMRRLVDLMLDKDALVFMDSTNVNTTCEYLGVSIPNPRYLPISVPASEDRRATLMKREFKANGLRVVWVGRVVDFKFFILQRSLVELNRLAPRLNLDIRVTLVGSGEYRQVLADTVTSLLHLRCDFVDHVAPADLDEFLISNADLLLAMGTSALEGARLGIPTLLLDFAHGPVSAGYVFRWLFERQGYTLGNTISDSDYVNGNTSLEERIGDLIGGGGIEISARCRQYFAENHDLSSMAGKLLEVLQKTVCTYGDMQRAGLLGRGMLYSVFAAIRRRFVRS